MYRTILLHCNDKRRINMLLAYAVIWQRCSKLTSEHCRSFRRRWSLRRCQEVLSR